MVILCLFLFKFNKLPSCQMPSWICCNLEGNSNEVPIDDYSSSSVEMDVYEASILHDGILPYKGKDLTDFLQCCEGFLFFFFVLIFLK